MQSELPKLDSTNIDQCMAEAATSEAKKDAMVNFSVRLPNELKASAMHICEMNGTDLGAFLRSCARSLVRDYSGSPHAE